MGESSDGLIPSTARPSDVTIEVRFPSFAATEYSITVDGSDVPVRRLGRGWFQIGDATRDRARRVQYQDRLVTDRITIARPEGDVIIRFRLRNTAFEFGGRTYRVRSLLGGQIRITDGPTVSLRGKVLLGRIRVDYISAALEPIGLELAFGLARKVAALRGLSPIP